mmetsp:Transcript_8029/g.17311  ORF Transcript_8029/g.17311 Transcript_8029/m.17311 type:complete len:227 (+) Transcript_8029:128-808(+)
MGAAIHQCHACNPDAHLLVVDGPESECGVCERGSVEVKRAQIRVDDHQLVVDRPDGDMRGLHVPAVFYDALEEQAEKDVQRECLQLALKEFVRALFQGFDVEIMLEAGGGLIASVTVDAELSALELSVCWSEALGAQPQSRTILFVEIDSVSAGKFADPQAEVEPEELCSTLVLRGGAQFLTFVFSSPDERAYFVTCMRVLIHAAKERQATGEKSGRHVRIKDQHD